MKHLAARCKGGHTRRLVPGGRSAKHPGSKDRSDPNRCSTSPGHDHGHHLGGYMMSCPDPLLILPMTALRLLSYYTNNLSSYYTNNASSSYSNNLSPAWRSRLRGRIQDISNNKTGRLRLRALSVLPCYFFGQKIHRSFLDPSSSTTRKHEIDLALYLYPW